MASNNHNDIAYSVACFAKLTWPTMHLMLNGWLETLPQFFNANYS